MNVRIRALVFLSAITALMAVLMPAAIADKPSAFPVGPQVFFDLDPCTGAIHELTVAGYGFVHTHNNNIVVKMKRTGITDSGYVLLAGNAMESFNGHVSRFAFKDVWKADDGRMMEVSYKAVFNENQFVMQLDKFVFRCISGPTIIP